MPVKFPRMHIAASTANRILNIADQIEMHGGAPMPIVAKPDPAVPYTTAEQGAKIDAQLSTPTPPMPQLGQAPDPGGTLEGKPALSTVLNPEG